MGRNDVERLRVIADLVIPHGSMHRREDRDAMTELDRVLCDKAIAILTERLGWDTVSSEQVSPYC